MPFIPLVAAGVALVGQAVSSENAKKQQEAQAEAARKAQEAQMAAAAQAAEDAKKAAQEAITSQQAAATTGAQKKQQAFADSVLTPGLINNQNALTQQLQDASVGKGPNPAQDMLNQSTSQNIGSQAALIAGQRGAGSNVGLMARQIAMQGANTQQQAAGQAATLNAQQQVAARGQLQSQLGGLTNAGVQAQQGAAQTALGNQGLTSQALMAASQQGSQLAGQSMAGQNAAALQAAGLQAQVGSQNWQNQNQAINGATAAAGQILQTGLAGVGGSGGAATAAQSSGQAMNDAMYAKAEGGEITKPGPKSSAGRFMQELLMSEGGKVPAIVSPGEHYLSPKDVKEVAQGKKPAIKAGEKIPGKPVVGGAKNSYANDTVKKTLDVGGIVLPRSVTQAKDPAKEAAKFVAAILAKKQGLRK